MNPTIPEAANPDSTQGPGLYPHIDHHPSPLTEANTTRGWTEIRQLDTGKLSQTAMEDGRIYATWLPDTGPRVRFHYLPDEGHGWVTDGPEWRCDICHHEVP